MVQCCHLYTLLVDKFIFKMRYNLAPDVSGHFFKFHFKNSIFLREKIAIFENTW
jgi:hypothetical protein